MQHRRFTYPITITNPPADLVLLGFSAVHQTPHDKAVASTGEFAWSVPKPVGRGQADEMRTASSRDPFFVRTTERSSRLCSDWACSNIITNRLEIAAGAVERRPACKPNGSVEASADVLASQASRRSGAPPMYVRKCFGVKAHPPSLPIAAPEKRSNEFRESRAKVKLRHIAVSLYCPERRRHRRIACLLPDSQSEQRAVPAVQTTGHDQGSRRRPNGGKRGGQGSTQAGLHTGLGRLQDDEGGIIMRPQAHYSPGRSWRSPQRPARRRRWERLSGATS